MIGPAKLAHPEDSLRSLLTIGGSAGRRGGLRTSVVPRQPSHPAIKEYYLEVCFWKSREILLKLAFPTNLIRCINHNNKV